MTGPAPKGTTVAELLRSLSSRVAELERSFAEEMTARQDLVSRIAALESSPASSEPSKPEKDVLAHVVELENRLRHLEQENEELSALCGQLREQNDAIANLYVAKHRLHASLDAGEIMRIIEEILVELVGAEQFAILFLEKKANVLKRVAGRDTRKATENVPFGQGLIGEVAAVGKPYYAEQPKDDTPLAIIPLRAQDSTVGVIVVHRLLAHRTTFTPVQHQLLELVAEHAPTALLSARLHRLSKSATPSART